jgi:NAD(P)-dependent dehydrogenase (short-subunit alcohol dehydrogenase family)
MNSEKSVLITGCSSGIGYTTAMGLQQRGYQVFASARRIEDVRRLRKEGLTCLQLDLDDSQSIQNAVDSLLEQTGGRLYGLFNNAGYGQPGAVEDLRRDVLRQQFETNVFGSMELTNQAIPVMRQQGEGRIIQNSSVLGFVSLAYRGAYNASKYALEGLYDTLRLELHGTNIFAVLIEPGPITSKFRENAFAAYKENIDIQNSAHRENYLATEQRLTREEAVAPFTLPAEAVLKKVILALEKPNPKPRYYVTVPTYIFGISKRFLTSRALDKILIGVSRKEQDD